MLPLINQFVYRPDATAAPPDLTPRDLGLEYEEVAVESEAGLTLSGWYLPGRGTSGAALLYCHGNAGDIRDWVHAAPPFVEAGIGVLVWDYRGYGQSEGQPSEAGLYRDGVTMWRWLHEYTSKNSLSPFLLGKSLGSAVAIHVAAVHAEAEEAPAGLILDSAFTSMSAVIANVAPVPRHLVPSLYENTAKAPAIHCPTLVVHGAQDQLVPLHQGRQIYETLTAPKAWHVLERAGHNDISGFPQYHRRLLAFLQDPAGYVNTARKP